jgi:hypothetical protein
MFGKNRGDISDYIDGLLTKYDKLIFEGLDRGDRHLVYKTSKNYTFNKSNNNNNAIEVYPKHPKHYRNVNRWFNPVDAEVVAAIDKNKVSKDITDVKRLLGKQTDDMAHVISTLDEIGESVTGLDTEDLDYKITGIYNLAYGCIIFNMSCVIVFGVRCAMISGLAYNNLSGSTCNFI